MTLVHKKTSSKGLANGGQCRRGDSSESSKSFGLLRDSPACLSNCIFSTIGGSLDFNRRRNRGRLRCHCLPSFRTILTVKRFAIAGGKIVIELLTILLCKLMYWSARPQQFSTDSTIDNDYPFRHKCSWSKTKTTASVYQNSKIQRTTLSSSSSRRSNKWKIDPTLMTSSKPYTSCYTYTWLLFVLLFLILPVVDGTAAAAKPKSATQLSQQRPAQNTASGTSETGSLGIVPAPAPAPAPAIPAVDDIDDTEFYYPSSQFNEPNEFDDDSRNADISLDTESDQHQNHLDHYDNSTGKCFLLKLPNKRTI